MGVKKKTVKPDCIFRTALAPLPVPAGRAILLAFNASILRESMRRLLLLFTIFILAACGEEKGAEEYMADARAHFEEGDFPAAYLELQNVMQLEPTSAEARFVLGKIHLELEDNAAAEKELTRAESLGWPVEETRPRVARAMLGQGRLDEALALSIEGLPPAPAARMMAIQVLAALLTGNTDVAQRLFDGAVELAPDDIEVRILGARMDAVQGRLENGLAEVELVLSDTPGYPEALRLKAHILLRMDRLQAARDAFTAAIEASGVDFADRVARATLNLRLDELDAVNADLAELERVAPNHASVRYIQGLMAFHDGRDRDAIDSLNAARPVVAKYPLSLYFLSLVHLLAGDAELAEHFATEFVEFAPETIRGRRLLAALLLKNGDYDKVQPALEPVRDFNPNDIYAMNIAAHSLLLDDRADQALFLFRWLGRLAPDTPPGRISLGAGLLTTSLGAERVPALEAVFADIDVFPREEIIAILGHMDKQDYEAALAAADSLKWRDTANIAPYNVIANVHIAAGQHEEAKEVLALALKRDPRNASANMTLAGLARRAGDNAAERKHYQAVLSGDSANVPALLSLAALEGREGDNDEMVAVLRQAADFNPTSLEPRLALARYFLDSGDPHRVADEFSRLLVLQQRSPRVLELFARAQMAEEEYSAAYAALRELTRIVDGTADHFYLLAGAAEALGKNEESRAALARALEIDEDYLPALMVLARQAELDGDEEALVSYIERLAEEAPDDPEVMRMQSVLAARRGDYKEGLRLAQQAHASGRTTATLLQFAEMQRRNGRASQARRLLNNWLRREPDDVLARLSLSDQLYAENKLDAAQAQYIQVLARDADNVLALNNLAWLLRKSDPNRALVLIRRAAKLVPGDPMVLDSRAVIEYLNGKHRAAAVVIQQALEAAPGNPSIRYHQAMIQNALGQGDAAREQLEDILADGQPAFPEQGEARALLESLGAG